MNESDNKRQIKDALAACGNAADFAESAKELFAAMGYRSSRSTELSCNAEEFIDESKSEQTKAQQSFCQHTKHITELFQYTETEINDDIGQQYEEGIIDNFLFYSVQLTTGSYSRNQYAEWTRVINKEYIAPVIVLFRCTDKAGNTKITFSFIGHRLHKRDNRRFVLEKASLLRQINSANPHRGHLDILNALTLTNRHKWVIKEKRELNFDSMLAAWLDELDTEALNNRFYDELEQWFTTAVKYVKFPLPSRLNPQERERYLKEHVMRLINRVLFIWFIKEKRLIAEELFKREQIKACLKDGIKDNGDNYYRAVLQNLFFATLNTEISERKFSPVNDENHRNFALYRYKDLIADKKRLLDYFSQTPFVNGGLFECLDSYAGKQKGGKRVDCFTDNLHQRKELSVPNWLFFGTDSIAGLFEILRKYKFVVEENTPIEQEVALDPELLGKVFERLLAHIDRKESGTYYTPRPVVDYMVQEALLAYFANAMKAQANANLKNRLQLLLIAETDYEELPPQDKLTNPEIKHFIDATNKLRLLEPAAGSGAFLMGVLTHLTMALLRIDPKNSILRAREIKHAKEFSDKKFGDDVVEIVEERFSPKNRYNNYARKLTVIRNCLYGVDISPAAVQTCRLRFFISLAIEQEVNKDDSDNYGIESLPNLEVQTIAADGLIGTSESKLFRDGRVKDIKAELKEIRRKFFTARKRKDKLEHMQDDEDKRKELSDHLQDKGYPLQDAERIAEWDLYDQTSTADWFDPEWMFIVNDGFDIVIGNPPYVRQEDIKPQEYKERLLKLYKEEAEGRSDLYVYFFLRGLQLLKDEGSLIFITSNSWLDVGFGAKFQDALLKQSHVKKIISSETSKEFYTADINTAISVIVRKEQWDKKDITTFLSYNSPIAAQGDVKEVKIANEDLKIGSKSLTAYRNKWGCLYLRAPDIFSRFISKHGGKLLRMDKEASVKYGTKTGDNDFFILDKEKIKKWQIEDEFFIPILHSPKDIDTLIVKPDSLTKYLLQCHNDMQALKKYNVAKYIRDGENQEIDKKPALRTRRLWYSLNGNLTYISMSYLMGDVVRFYTSDVEYVSADNFVNVITDKKRSYQIAAFANSIIMQFIVNVLSRKVHGGGLMQVKTYEIATLPILDPDELDYKKCRQLLSYIGKDKLDSPNREALDEYICDSLGVSKSEQRGIYDATMELIEKRNQKAGSTG